MFRLTVQRQNGFKKMEKHYGKLYGPQNPGEVQLAVVEAFQGCLHPWLVHRRKYIFVALKVPLLGILGILTFFCFTAMGEIYQNIPTMYEWNGREQELYKLYVEERKSLDEVMEYMKSTHGFTPSKRAYQTQFKRWDFPSKQNPAHKNVPLVERTRQLWESNTSQKDMLRILKDEGFSIKERELMRVRAKNRWLLRMPNGMKTHSGYTIQSSYSKEAQDSNTNEREDAENVENQIQDLIMAENEGNNQRHEQQSPEALTSHDQVLADISLPLTTQLSPQIQQKRAQRLEKLQAESADRLATKKRRRRTRGWAGLPADPPAPPRFPSETTLDESKAYLHLDNILYREIRDQFTNICQEAGFIKKTLAGPERWEEAKNKLIAESAHLYRQFNGPFNGVPFDSKKLALDVLCTDVTKRMRTLERRMTIAEAKNVLGVNPEQSRQIRNQFYEVLKADHFTSKLETGEEHWNELKQQWVAGSTLLQEILPSLEDHQADEHLSEKHRAADVLCRDVMKRLRDEQTKLDPGRKKQVNEGPGPGPAPPRVVSTATVSQSPIHDEHIMNSPSINRNRPAPQANMTSPRNVTNNTDDLQIDPTLLAAAANSAPNETSNFDQLRNFAVSASASEQHIHSQAHSAYTGDVPGSIPTPSHQISALFRVSDDSELQVNTGNRIWPGIIISTSISDLTQIILQRFRGARIFRIDAVVVNSGDSSENLVTLESDEALREYFERGANGNPVFNVALG